MPKYNINTMLMIIGVLLLLVGFFTSPKDTYGLHLQTFYSSFGQAAAIRTVGLLTVLNGLLYFLIENRFAHFNRRFKYFGITLFFISLIIVSIVVGFMGVPSGVGNSELFSLSDGQNSTATLVLMAGLFTLGASLLMPVVIMIMSLFDKR